MSASAVSPAEHVRAVAEELGFVATWAPAELPDFVGARYRGWLADGNHALMGELLRGLDVRLDATQRFGWARSVLVLAIPHAYGEPAVPADDGARLGRVGRVFWVREQSFVERLARPGIDAVK
ncbi:MAG: tRNA epoxyqueuosine(34) reductase QueG, partial [Solirubrobacteraceae bacterium]